MNLTQYGDGKCNWNQTHSGAAREVGCPLDHCPVGHHVFGEGNAPHCTPECYLEDPPEQDNWVARAEACAGWDANP